jgi:hypothetical protein
MMSSSSLPSSVGRAMPRAFMASAISGPWFHMAAATITGEFARLSGSSPGPTRPPAPPTA